MPVGIPVPVTDMGIGGIDVVLIVPRRFYGVLHFLTVVQNRLIIAVFFVELRFKTGHRPTEHPQFTLSEEVSEL